MSSAFSVSLSSLALFCIVGAGCATSGAGGREGGGSGANGPAGGGGFGQGGNGPGITVILPSCGDGKLDAGEACDDGNTASGDGCTGACRLEDGWVCPGAGIPCTNNSMCGDGVIVRSKECEDGNTMDGDGCSSTCKVEEGWLCPVPGQRCIPICGNGVITATQACDDGNTEDGDGCSSTCQIEPGSSCEGMPSVCTRSECGNGMQEAGESCDAGPLNGLFYGDGSGCSKSCTKEPICREGAMTRACDTSCGNGNVEAGEECDDGNLNDGDGCSSTCQFETGFTCSIEPRPDTEPCTESGAGGECLKLPVIYRDFKSERETDGHPDFFYHGATVKTPVMISGVAGQPAAINFNKRYCVPNSAGPAKLNDSTARCWDIASANLNDKGKPVFNATRNGGGASATLCACQFTDWSHLGNEGHVPDYGDAMLAGRPLNGLTYNAGPDGRPQYRGQAPIVTSAESFGQWWVDNPFTNDTHIVQNLELAPIAGGLYQFSSAHHTIYGGFFPLDPPANMFPLYNPAGSMAGPGTVRTSTTGNNEPLLCNFWPYWYSTAQFGAMNNCQGQQYILPPTATAAECNITDANNMSWLNGCWANQGQSVQGWFHNSWFSSEARYLFVFNGPFSLQFFGDDDLFIYINGVLVADLGGVHQRLPARVDVDATGSASIVEGGSINQATGQINPCPGMDPYTMEPTTMGVDCRARTAALGLEMGRTYEIAIFHADRGAPESNYQLTLSGFSTNRSVCVPRCGDGIVTGSEECDCGDGSQASQPPECGGNTNDDTRYGGCTTQCKWGPFCGDGETNGEEQCDAGWRDNNARYNEMGCMSTCLLPPRCGDGVIDSAFDEECDDGPNNGSAAGACDANCRLPPK